MFLLTELTGQIDHCKVIENLMFEVLAVWEHFQLKKLPKKKCPQKFKNGLRDVQLVLVQYVCLLPCTSHSVNLSIQYFYPNWPQQ